MDQSKLNAIASDLEGMLPQMQMAPAHALGGLLPMVTSLVASLKSGDVAGILTGVRDIINALLGTAPSATVPAHGIQQQALAWNIDWMKLITLISKLLPEIFS